MLGLKLNHVSKRGHRGLVQKNDLPTLTLNSNFVKFCSFMTSISIVKSFLKFANRLLKWYCRGLSIVALKTIRQLRNNKLWTNKISRDLVVEIEIFNQSFRKHTKSSYHGETDGYTWQKYPVFQINEQHGLMDWCGNLRNFRYLGICFAHVLTFLLHFVRPNNHLLRSVIQHIKQIIQ